MTPIKRASVGFTLIELLVALLIFASISVLISNALYTAAKTWSRNQADIEKIRNHRVEEAAIRRVLSRYIPMSIRSGGKQIFLFEGGKDYMRFSGALPPYVEEFSHYMLELRRSDDSHETLGLYFTPLDFSSDEQISKSSSDWQYVSVVDQLSQIDIEYFGRLDDESPLKWYSSWSRDNVPPKLVRITLASRNGSGDNLSKNLGSTNEYIVALASQFSDKSPTHAYRPF